MSKKEDFKHSNWEVRLRDYLMLGSTKEALKDSNWTSRLRDCIMLGFTREALNHPDASVREAAEKYFKGE